MFRSHQSLWLIFIIGVMSVVAAENKKRPEVCEVDACKPFIPKRYPRNCDEAYKMNQAYGLQLIQLDAYGPNPFYVQCVQNATLIQKRTIGHPLSFNRTWEHYKHGFGDLQSDFFLGLEKIHALTTDRVNDLYVVFSDSSSVGRYIRYDLFVIGSEAEDYALQILGAPSGDAADGLSAQSGAKFSTVDRNNAKGTIDCGFERGPWWYHDCKRSDIFTNLNYLSWADVNGSVSALISASMQIRPLRDY